MLLPNAVCLSSQGLKAGRRTCKAFRTEGLLDRLMVPCKEIQGRAGLGRSLWTSMRVLFTAAANEQVKGRQNLGRYDLMGVFFSFPLCLNLSMSSPCRTHIHSPNHHLNLGMSWSFKFTPRNLCLRMVFAQNRIFEIIQCHRPKLAAV